LATSEEKYPSKDIINPEQQAKDIFKWKYAIISEKLAFSLQ
jgi:hypothetical protein